VKVLAEQQGDLCFNFVETPFFNHQLAKDLKGQLLFELSFRYWGQTISFWFWYFNLLFLVFV